MVRTLHIFSASEFLQVFFLQSYQTESIFIFWRWPVRKVASLTPVYTGDFCCDFVAISRKLLAIPQRFESPVVYTGDLKSP